MKIVCLDADTLGNDIDLEAIFSQVGEFVSYSKTAPNQVIERLNGADIVLTNKVIIDENVIKNTNLKLICVTATGVNNIDLNAAQKAKIVVKNVADYSTNSVVQQTFASLFALLNQTAYYDKYAKSPNGWAKSEIFVHLGKQISQISSKKFGIVGLGNIGKSVAKVAKSFGCKVGYFSTSGQNKNKKYKKLSFKKLLKCDIISIHAPLNENTKNLFCAKTIKRLKNGTILMNFGRGGIVDEKAVAKAIENEQIYFVSDVLSNEPIEQNHPFLGLKNKDRLILTPHIAWSSLEARKKLIEITLENINNFMKK
nr:D-2-hydroxyacid dehydrogenase [Campylobacter sp.]